MLSQLIYVVLTVAVPLQKTYVSLNNADGKTHELWSIYWALFAIYQFISNFFCCLKWGPLEVIALLFFCWLYHSTYQGAFVVASFVQNKLQSNSAFQTNFNKIRPYLIQVNLLEQSDKKKE